MALLIRRSGMLGTRGPIRGSGTFGRNTAAAESVPSGMDLRMSEDERQAFLAGVHIGVISIEREDGPTHRADLVRLRARRQRLGHHGHRLVEEQAAAQGAALQPLRADRRGAILLLRERRRGVVSVEPTDEDGVGRPMAHRYFGAELGDLYIESIKGEASLTWTMRPERWWSVDYAKTGRVDPRTT